ncbi:MAG: flippase-like domain-containing protein [Chloroflexi bacterium]|nr:flippase-like domain-containing protein [Chloroflexota bacterium]
MLGLVVFGALAVYGDALSIFQALDRFRWELLPAILGLTLLNYLLRLVKWNFYLRLIGITGVGRLDSFLLFFSGLSMVVTPGKVGEWLKSYLLREVTGTPFSRSAPIILAERLTDGIAMLILATAGVVVFGLGWQILAVVAVTGAAIVFVSQHRPLALRLLTLGERLPLVSRRIHHLHGFYESSFTLLRLPNLLLAIGLGLVSWSGECVAFYLVLVGLGVEPSSMLLLQATFVLATTTLAGAVFLLPGGLGVAEGGITALLQMLLALSPDRAVAAALIIRFCTLWFGVAVGIVCLTIFSRRLPTMAYSSSSSSPASPSKKSSL